MRALRRDRPDLAVGRGERLLAWCDDVDGRTVGGTRDALYLPDHRIPWEQVEATDWDADAEVLTVKEVGSWGAVRPVHRLGLDDPGRLLQLVRERVTATVVLQRHVPLDGRRGVRVIARRAPSGDRSLSWVYEYDEGVDPADPVVRAKAEEALASAQDEVGTS
ncbi:MAG: hypothetical protein ABIQ15_09475 [Nocardioides sp.]